VFVGTRGGSRGLCSAKTARRSSRSNASVAPTVLSTLQHTRVQQSAGAADATQMCTATPARTRALREAVGMLARASSSPFSLAAGMPARRGSSSWSCLGSADARMGTCRRGASRWVGGQKVAWSGELGAGRAGGLVDGWVGGRAGWAGGRAGGWVGAVVHCVTVPTRCLACQEGAAAQRPMSERRCRGMQLPRGSQGP